MAWVTANGLAERNGKGKSPFLIESVTGGQYDARPTVTFLGALHHRRLAGTKLYCLLTGLLQKKRKK